MKDENVVATDPNAQPTPQPAPAADPATPADPAADPNAQPTQTPVADPAAAPVVPDPQTPVNLSTGLPEDAVLQPEDVNTQQQGGDPNAQATGDPAQPSPEDDDERLKAIEDKADAIRNPEGGNPAQGDPAITDPNAQQPLSEAQRLANIEAWIAGQAQQQQPAQTFQPQPTQPVQQPGQTGAGDAYNADPYAQTQIQDPYTQNPDPYAQPTQPAPQVTQPQTQGQQPVNPNVMMDWMGFLFNQNEELTKRLDNYEAQQTQNTQRSMFRQRYNVSDDTIDRAVALAKDGDLMDAFTLLEGRSHAGQANQQAREQRQQDRELAGTPTMSGGAPQASDPNNQVAAAQAAYAAAKALPPGAQKDKAMIDFRNDFGEIAKTLMESQIGGTLTTQAVVSPTPGV